MGIHSNTPRPKPVPHINDGTPCAYTPCIIRHAHTHEDYIPRHTKLPETANGDNYHASFHQAMMKTVTEENAQTNDVSKENLPGAEDIKVKQPVKSLQDLNSTNAPGSTATVVAHRAHLLQTPAGSPPVGNGEKDGGNESEVGKLKPGPINRHATTAKEGNPDGDQLVVRNLPLNTLTNQGAYDTTIVTNNTNLTVYCNTAAGKLTRWPIPSVTIPAKENHGTRKKKHEADSQRPTKVW